ncbi:MAG: cytochrome ubiquinol oxidase subunit I [Chloroflexota bacterium]
MVEPTQIPDVARRLAIAFFTLGHIQFAAFLIGLFGIGVTMELFGILDSRQKHFERMAHGIGFTCVVGYSTGAVLAIVFIAIFTLTFPTLWYVLVRQTFWPFWLEANTFLLTILFLFPWYYTWDRLARFKWVHLSLGLALIVVTELQQTYIDVVASYMLTPAPQQPLLRVFLNPTAIPLDSHRLVGDLSFAGFVIAGFAGIQTLRARDPERRAFFDWVGHIGLLAGVGFLFLQPLIGIEYVEEIRVNSTGAFDAMMRGRLSWMFNLLVVSVSALFFMSVYYMLLQLRKSGRKGVGELQAMLVIIGISGAFLVQPYVLGPSQLYMWVNWVNPLGAMQPWKYMAFGAMTLAAITAIILFMGNKRRGLRWGSLERGGRQAQYILIGLAVLTSMTMVWMGYIRESSRSPYLIYYDMFIEEQQHFPRIENSPTPTTGPSAFDTPQEGSPSYGDGNASAPAGRSVDGS